MAVVFFTLRPEDAPDAYTLESSIGRFISLRLGPDLTVYPDSPAQARAIAAALTLAADTIDPPPVGELRLKLAQEAIRYDAVLAELRK